MALIPVFLFIVPANFYISFSHPWSQGQQYGVTFTESKHILLTTCTGKKSRDRFLGLGNKEFYPESLHGWEDGGIVSQIAILSELEFRLLIYQREEVIACCKLLVSESFVLASFILVKSWCPCKLTRQMLFSVLRFPSLYEREKVIPLKGRPLRMGCPVYFRI